MSRSVGESKAAAAPLANSLRSSSATRVALSGSAGEGFWRQVVVPAVRPGTGSKGRGNQGAAAAGGPTPRWGHSATMVDGKMVVFGGYGDQKFSDETFVFDPSAIRGGGSGPGAGPRLRCCEHAWRRCPGGGGAHCNGRPHAPTPRSNHAACAVGRYLLIVHGGCKGGASETYHAFDVENRTWAAVEPVPAAKNTPLPVPRSGHTACLLGGSLVAVFGGKAGRPDTSSTFLVDVRPMLSTTPTSSSVPLVSVPPRDGFQLRVLDGEQESMMDPKPVARRFHSMVSHAPSGAAVLFGGCHSDYQCLGDTWVLRRSNPGDRLGLGEPQDAANQPSVARVKLHWSKVTAQGQGPSRRWGHSAAMVGDSMVIVGGRAASDLMDIFVLTLASLSRHPLVASTADRWSSPTLPGPSSAAHFNPAPRRRAAAAVVDAENRILLFGGYDGKFRDDLLSLEVTGFETAQMPAQASPPMASAVPVASGRTHAVGGAWGVPVAPSSSSSSSSSPPPPIPAYAAASLDAPPPAPQAPPAPGSGFNGMFAPPPSRTQTVAHPLGGHANGSTPAAANAASPATPLAPNKVQLECVDGSVAMDAADAAVIRRQMPGHKAMPTKLVAEALPFLRKLGATRGAAAAAAGPSGEDAVADTVGAAAVRFGWGRSEDVGTVIALGYAQPRVFRACFAVAGGAGRLPQTLTLNQLLDAAEAQAERSPQDAAIARAFAAASETSAGGAGGPSPRRRAMTTGAAGRGSGSGGAAGGASSDLQRALAAEAQLAELREDLSSALTCTISMELMADPVVTPAGHLYERSQIAVWIRSHQSDPQTRGRLKMSQLTRVRVLKELSKKYRKRGVLT